MIYSQKQLINNGIMNFISFGKYWRFSARVIGADAVVGPLPSINDVVEDVSVMIESVAFDSFMK